MKEVAKAKDSILKLNFLSHGTLESRDLEKSRRFYEDFLGFEVVRTSDVSLMIRLGGSNAIAVVKSQRKKAMPVLNHNGLDVETKEEVEEAYRMMVELRDKWGIGKITKPRMQHGTYSFYFQDLDDNWWEILTNPKGGYSWLFDLGDLEGRGHQAKSFVRPGLS